MSMNELEPYFAAVGVTPCYVPPHIRQAILASPLPDWRAAGERVMFQLAHALTDFTDSGLCGLTAEQLDAIRLDPDLDARAVFNLLDTFIAQTPGQRQAFVLLNHALLTRLLHTGAA